jgi:hypothetical protein
MLLPLLLLLAEMLMLLFDSRQHGLQHLLWDMEANETLHIGTRRLHSHQLRGQQQQRKHTHNLAPKQQ